jgi:hypothetical protein
MHTSRPSDHAKLELLVRKNRGRAQHDAYVDDLGRILGAEIGEEDLLDLETTDRLLALAGRAREDHSRRTDIHVMKTWPYESASAWLRECERVEGALGGEEAVLFVGPYLHCGAARVSVEQALRAAPALLDFDGDTVYLSSLDGNSGMYLDKYEERSEWFVELVVWGEWGTRVAEPGSQ